LLAGETVVIRYSGRVEPGFEPTRINGVATADCPPAVVADGVVTLAVCDDEPETAEVRLPGLKVEKAADESAVHRPGQAVRYTVTLTNVGRAAYTTEDPARVVDDLSGVLDDAVLDAASISPKDTVWDEASSTIAWSGPLAVGAKQTIEYSVAYAPGADLTLDNTAWIHDEDAVDATPGTKARVTVPGSDLHLMKTADVATTEPGGTVRYAIVLDNSRGQAAAPVGWTDDLSGALDDAILTGDPIVAGEGVTARRDGRSLVLSGELAAGAKATVTYAVTVLDGESERGDGTLRNALVGECEDGACPPPEECREDDPLTTCTPVVAYSVTKEAVIPQPGRAPGADETVSYRLTFVNTGAADVPVTEVDDLSDVLDDADWIGTDLSEAEALTAEFDGTRLKVRGSLAVGGTAVVSYSVRIRPAAARADSILVNRVAPADIETRTPVGELSVVKMADPPRAKPGQTVGYKIELRAQGAVPARVALVDSLIGVLDDGDVVRAPASDNPAVRVGYTAGAARIELEGELGAGERATVAYSVKVKPEGQTGDDLMTNVVVEHGHTPFDSAVHCSSFPEGSCTSTPVDVPIDAGPAALAFTGSGAALVGGAIGLVSLASGTVLVVRARRRISRGA
jgi:uncharacterized repeat protein (TIGR01451 family)